MSRPDGRPNGNAAAGPQVRPAYGLEQQQYAPPASHKTPQSYHRQPPATTASSQPSIFGNPHGIRDRPALVAQPKPPVVVPKGNTNSTRPGALASAKNPFTSNTPSLNHLGIPGYHAAAPSQPPMQMPMPMPAMPGAFPSETIVPYRRPTDVSTQLSMSTSNDSAEHFSNDDVWDSEGDSGSCLSTSTDATTVASDVTEKGESYHPTAAPAHASASSGSTTPTQSPQSHHAQLDISSSHHAQRAPILRRAGHKSVLSAGSKTSSLSTSSTRSSTLHPTKASSISTGSGSSTAARRNSHSSGPHVHIEVNRSMQPRESQSDLRKRRMIEEALIDKIEQLKSEQSPSRESSPPSSLASVPSSRQGLSVRFAEPEKEEVEKPRTPEPEQEPEPEPVVQEQPKPQEPTPVVQEPEKLQIPEPPAPVVSEQEKNLSKELVLQIRGIQKLEQELEKRDLLIREKEKLEQETKLKEESAAAVRKEEHERQLKRLEKERDDAVQAQKERERAVQEEVERLYQEKKELEKVEQERERALQKELERLENERKEIEKAEKEREEELQRQRELIDKEKQGVEKAQKEHDELQASFIDQGKILSDLKSRFDSQAKQLEDTEAERAELQKTKDDFEHKCSDLSRTLSHVSDKERFVVEQVASLQIIKEALQGRLGPMEKQVEEQKQEINKLTEERDGLYGDVKTYLLRITELETEIKSLVEEKREFIAQVGELEKAKGDLQDEVKDRDVQIATLTENIEAQAKDTKEHISTLKDEHSKALNDLQTSKQTELDGLREEHTAFVAELEDRIAGLNEHIEGAHVDIDNLKNNLTSLEGNLAEEKTKSDSLVSERDNMTTELEAHKSLAASQEANVINLRGDIAAKDEELATLKETNSALQTEHEELEKLKEINTSLQAEHEELEKLKEANTSLQAEHDELEKLKEVNVSLQAEHEELEKLKEVNTSLEAEHEELERLKEANSALQAEHEELQKLADSLDDRQSHDTTNVKDLQAKNEELEAQITSTKTELEERIQSLEGERDNAASALIIAQAELSSAKEAAEKVPALEEEAAKVPALTSEKAELEGKVADLEAHASQVPALRAHCDKLTEQLSAANKLIEGLTAAAQAGLSTPVVAPVVPEMAPPSPMLPQDIPVPDSPRLAPQGGRKVRSRAPSMVRSISSRSSASTRREKGPKDDMALVLVRDSKDRGSVTVVRKCDLRSPRSRSQPPVKE
ncbi:hypothetical protein SLS53_004356 [Cytospora paraplurivora]|uniref:Uncharacterized protein n=1 Tax=Cytospora paraplurivora TaxID=2898453 RepID=A0AAN9YGM8_9PEZI